MAAKLRLFYTPELFMGKDVMKMRDKVEGYLLNHPDAPLILAADTMGGVSQPMIQTLEAFRALRGERMTTYVASSCWSSGLLVMAAAERRVALSSARFMIHEPMLDLVNLHFVQQRAETISNIRGFLDEAERMIYDPYFSYLDRRTGQPDGFWRAKAQPAPDVHFYSSQQMLEWKLLTHVVETFDEMRAIALQA